MKLSSIFKLYKSYYPKAAYARVTIADEGGMMQISDRRRYFRLNVLGGGRLYRLTADDVPEENPLTKQFIQDNRREMFMIGETQSLYGIVYAENLSHDLKLMSIVSGGTQIIPRPEAKGVSLSYLFALSDKLTRKRYSVSSITLDRCGVALVTSGQGEDITAIKLDFGGKIFAGKRGGKTAYPVTDYDSLRYARLFWRDNAEWFANFAAGKEEEL